MSITKQDRDKFQPRVKPCVFMGYPFGQKGYKVMDLENNKFYVSRDVVFHEKVFSFGTPHQDKPLFSQLLFSALRKNILLKVLRKSQSLQAIMMEYLILVFLCHPEHQIGHTKFLNICMTMCVAFSRTQHRLSVF